MVRNMMQLFDTIIKKIIVHTSTQLSGLDNYGLPPNIYKGCVLNKSLRNEVTDTQTQQPQS